MSFVDGCLFFGSLLLSMVVLGALVNRLPLSSAMVYLVVGWLLGSGALGVIAPDPRQHAAVLELGAEIALLISLFAVGLQLGVPLRDRRWWLPVRLAFLSTAAMVAMLAAVGVWMLDLPVGAAVLLGAILAPTDPVLASGVHAEPGNQPDRLGFSLAGEGGLNDGTAFTFVMLGLVLLDPGLRGGGWTAWWTGALLWAVLGGLGIGAALGALIGRLVLHLRSRRGEAAGLDVFLGLGLIALAYGATQRLNASGFLAVFAAGLALGRVRDGATGAVARLGSNAGAPDLAHEASASRAEATLRDSVQLFNGQLEKLAELALVLAVGAMLPFADPRAAAWWFVPLLLLVLRPLSTLPATIGERLTLPQSVMIGWFGIRGIGSVYYLLYVLRTGVDPQVAETLTSLTLWTVATSIVVHGLTAQPLMRRYVAWRGRSVRADDAARGRR